MIDGTAFSLCMYSSQYKKLVDFPYISYDHYKYEYIFAEHVYELCMQNFRQRILIFVASPF